MTGRPDFVSRLAARASGVLPAVRPRIPSRFEAMPDPGGELSAPEPVMATARGDNSRPEPELSAPHRAMPPARADNLRAPASHEPAHPIAAAARRVDVGRSATELSAPEMAIAPARADNSVRAVEKGGAPGVREPVSGDADIVVRAVPVASQAVRRDITPALDAAPSDPTSVDAEPSVVISIGRVEVRAAPPVAPPAPRPRAAVPKDGLPLHDYLRGRRDAR